MFAVVPGHGHVNPLLPLARMFAKRGHRITFVTGAEIRARVEQLGFDCMPAGPTLEEMQSSALADPEVRAFGPAEPWQVAAAIFAGRARGALRDLEGVDLRPDLVVHDAYELAGPILAARAGVPWVSHAVGPRWPSFLEARVGELAADLWDETGARTTPPQGGIGHHAYVEICPAAVRSDDSAAAATLVESRPVPLDEPPHRAATFPLSGRPRIYVTFGTFTNAYPGPFRSLLDACGTIDADVIMTVGERVDLAALGRIPENVRVERYVPQAQVLDQCDLVVCHGGSGTVLAALGRAVPLVIVPQGADQFRNAPFWQRSGAVVVVDLAELSSKAVEAALATAGPGGPLRLGAMATAAAIAAMPPVEAVADRIETMIH